MLRQNRFPQNIHEITPIKYKQIYIYSVVLQTKLRFNFYNKYKYSIK